MTLFTSLLLIFSLTVTVTDATLPPLSSVHLFTHIDRHTIGQCLMLNRRYRCHLAAVKQLYPGSGSVERAMEDALLLYRAWDALDDAQRDCFTKSNRRKYLNTLREIIGDEAFYRGEMPFPLPRWALGEIR